MNHIKRAEQATSFGQLVTGFAAMLLVIISLGHLALRGDDIRASRQGITVEQMHEQERAEIQRQISEYRAANPNNSRCSHNCIARIPTTGEVWK
jgi:hypothetical protein